MTIGGNVLRGEENPMYGKTHTDITRDKISKKLKNKYTNEEHHMNGRKLPDTTRKKIRDKLRTISKTKNKGISWNKTNKNWRVYITINNKFIHLGCFNNIDDAISARKNAELKYWNKENNNA